MNELRPRWWVGALAFAIGCGGTTAATPDTGAGSADAGMDGSATGECATDGDCRAQRGLYCDGDEVCTGGRCFAGTPPCPAALCNEGTDTCATARVDFDRDGSPAGMDCDDNDAARYPGNEERCDTIDNDCRAATLGPDRDSDGSPGMACCNPQSDGMIVCGLDCNDDSRDVSPSAPESCNGIDDNCNGIVDEGQQTTFYVDADGDMYGSNAMGAMTRMACTPPPGFSANATDCDDTRAAINPGNAEVCDAAMRDENCNGTQNERCTCVLGSAPVSCCGGQGTQTCTMTASGAALGPCSQSATTEVACDGLDNDCNGGDSTACQTDFTCPATNRNGCVCSPGRDCGPVNNCGAGARIACTGPATPVCRPTVTSRMWNGADTPRQSCAFVSRTASCVDTRNAVGAPCYVVFGQYLRDYKAGAPYRASASFSIVGRWILTFEITAYDGNAAGNVMTIMRTTSESFDAGAGSNPTRTFDFTAPSTPGCQLLEFKVILQREGSGVYACVENTSFTYSGP